MSSVFSIEDIDSMMNRWAEGPSVPTSTEFERLLSVIGMTDVT